MLGIATPWWLLGGLLLLDLLREVARPVRSYQVLASELHSMWLARLLKDEWEPFAFVERETSMVGQSREGNEATRLHGYVLLRRRCRVRWRMMTPDDEARFHCSTG